MARQKKSDTAWSQPATPPPPLFTGEKERNLVKQVNDELIERVVGQQILYFPIDVERTNFHPLYGEAIDKTFYAPVKVFALIKFNGDITKNEDSFGLDSETTIEIHFHKKRLTEDQNLFVREGDFVLYGDRYYEITELSQPKRLFGQIENKFEIMAKCFRVRENAFNPQFTANTIPTTRETTSTSTGSASTYNPTSNGLFNNLTVQNNTTTKTITVNSMATFNAAINYETSLVSGSYSVISSDFIIGVNTDSLTASITLPAVSLTTTGRYLIIKDETGNATTNFIHISASAGDTIDEESTFTIDADFGAVNLYCTSTGWHVI